MNKKILIVSLVYYPDFVGGAEVSVSELTDRMEGDFDMICLRGNQSKIDRIGNIKIHRVGFKTNTESFLGRLFFNFQKYFFPFFVWLKGRSLHKKNNYDSIWSIMANYSGFGALFLKKTFPKINFLLTLQEGDPISYIKRRVFFVYPIFKSIFRKADKIHSISNYLKSFAKEMGFKKEVQVIPNGVDIENFKKEVGEETKKKIKEKLNISEKDKVVITTSRLVVKNGLEDLIISMSFLEENYKLLILGTGKLEHKLKTLVERYNLTDRIKFVGFIPKEKIPYYFSVSDIFVRPSISEGLGNSFLEAMAAGLPVIGTPVGGILDFLKDGETGLLTPPKNPYEISRSIKRLEDKDLREKIIKNGKEVVSRKYSWDIISKEMESRFF